MKRRKKDRRRRPLPTEKDALLTCSSVKYPRNEELDGQETVAWISAMIRRGLNRATESERGDPITPVFPGTRASSHYLPGLMSSASRSPPLHAESLTKRKQMIQPFSIGLAFFFLRNFNRFSWEVL